jgi:hypothetical protein
MAFKFSFRVDPEAMTVPYAPITDDIRRNRGFIDLRGRPNEVDKIAEGNESAALRRLLVRVAAVGSPIFTIGCDLGAHREPTNVPVRRREVAGGYIQFASVQFEKTKSDSYAALANAIVAHVKARTGEDNWRIDFIGKWVNFQFEGEPNGIYASLWIWFFAAARDPTAALQSRPVAGTVD